MRASSETIAQLAAALAKAQIEVVNPVKSLTAVMDRWGTGNEGQSYRYAPLSAGLEIVRKTLCKHELAVIQTTAVDHQRGFVLLTTMLAHGSGEWVSAAWPVCRTSDMSNPKLMGAALTYARRYGLFTLVGLAGEDDLDAPELARGQEAGAVKPPPSNGAAAAAVASLAARGDQNSDQSPSPENFEIMDLGGTVEIAPPLFEQRPRRRRRRDAGIPRGNRPSPESAAGDQLRELARIEAADDLFRWALAILPARNELDEACRAALDEAFLARAEALGADPELLIAFAPAPPAEATQLGSSASA